MKSRQMDIMVMLRNDLIDDSAIELELQRIQPMLMSSVRLDTLSEVHELHDLNRFKIIRRPDAVADHIRLKEKKPFIFLANKN